MLRRLRIENLAVVEDATLEFEPGLNVLSGSTGAGKSLILGAVNLLLGEKSSHDMVRAGAAEARVEAHFSDVDPARHGVVAPFLERGALRVSRRVSSAGRSLAALNDRAVPVRELRAVCSELIEPHGQNEQYRLRDPARHVDYVDQFARNDALRARYAEALVALRGARADLAAFDAELKAMREKRELYAHRLEEIDRVAPQPGERESLEATARLYANAEKIYAALDGACASLYDDDASASALTADAIHRLTAIAALDARVADLVERLNAARSAVDDAASEARGILGELEFEPADVERVQERLDALVKLERRYGAPIGELLEQTALWRRLLDALDDGPGARQGLEHACERSAAAVAAAGLELGSSRARAARDLDLRVSAELESLGLRKAVFRTLVSRTPDPASDVRVDGEAVAVFDDGLDVIRMRVRTNPGEAEGDLDTIASTGELSRIALVLKRAIASEMSTATLIFDEIDAGVGADLGDALAEKLLALAERHQIICITHMPQIAARAHSHLVVMKEIEEDRTRVRVRRIDGAERTREIARMLGGEEGSDRRLALAAELLGRSPRTRDRVRP